MTLDHASATQLLDRLIATPIGDRARVLDDTGDAKASLAALIEHVGRTAMSDSVKGDATTDIVVNLADRVGSNLDRARARRVRVHMLSFAGRFDEALAASDEGRRLAKATGEAIEAARMRLASMHALGELGRLDEAIAAGEAAREEFLAIGETAFAGRADLNLGTARQRGDAPAAALRHFDRARAALLDDAAMLGPLDNNRGEALLSLNEFAAAERAFASALQSFKANNAAIPVAIAESNLADVATRQGRLQAAMLHFEQARRALEGGASPAHLARLLAEQAEAFSMLGLHTQALSEYERALIELDRLGLALEAARARTGLGTVLLRLGKHAQAETALAAAATAFDELRHETARARVDLLRAELASINKRHGDARAIALRALAALHNRPADAAAAHLTLARIALRDGRNEQAEPEFQQALTVAAKLDIAPLHAEILRQRGEFRHADSRLSEAIDDLTHAVEQIERVRGSLAADRFRMAFLGARADAYESLTRALLDRSGEADVARAFTAIERSKSRGLLDGMQRDLAEAEEERSATPGDQPLLAQLQAAREELNALYSVVDRADGHRDAKANDASRSAAWRERVRRCEAHVDDIESRIATTAGLGAIFGQTVSLEALQQGMPGDAAIIEYFTIGDEIIALVITNDSTQAFRNVGSVANVARLLQSLQFQINRALRPGATEGERGGRLLADAHRVLSELGDQLLKPMLRGEASIIAACERLFMVPHGILHGVPFHALMTAGEHLVQEHAVSLAPSTSMLARLMHDRPNSLVASPNPVVVGVADELAPQIEDEARLVAHMIHCPEKRTFIGGDATVDRVLAAAGDATHMHFACHGRYAPNSPLGSGLKLADRWLTARELMRTRLRADLVTLSGCETGLNLVQAGDELMGLLRGFFAAGAKAAMASLWRVDDSITREFMAGFHGCLNTLGSDPSTHLHAAATALARAQRDMLSRHPHPAFWAAFFLTGF